MMLPCGCDPCLEGGYGDDGRSARYSMDWCAMHAAAEATETERNELKAALRRVGEALRGTGERVYADGSVCWCDEDDQGDHAPHCRTARAALAKGETR